MSRGSRFAQLVVVGMAATPVIAGGPNPWPTFRNETAARLSAPADVGVSDVQEKDYAWGDVDRDGDVDLVCVRKEPWNTAGRFRNVLLLNEGTAQGHMIDGVLVDRTAEFATAASDGGQGFLDATADRDVALVDVNGDGWLDIVTSTTYGEGLSKTISHPRVYRNLGNDGGGLWQGFRYEAARTPTMPITPHFCGIGVGDVTGDDAPDLYFVDYNNDLEDRLWINNGQGNFSDESEARLTFAMRESDFGVHAVIGDLNGDGVNDIVKDRGSTNVVPPLRVSASYNNPAMEGFFNRFETIYSGNPYHVGVGDLNGDGMLDIVIEDDGTDRYFLNQGNGPDGLADFTSATFSGQSDSFGGNIVIIDINQDGHDDVLIADVDVDCCGCNRHLRFWKNLGDTPAVTFQEESGGITIPDRTGTHDVAVFDINGDTWLDFVIGTCTGTSVWIAEPPVQLNISYPQGLPFLLAPGEETVFDVLMEPFGGEVDSGSARLHVSVNGGPDVTSPLESLGEDLYQATLPASVCLDRMRVYVSATVSGAPFTDPPDAPASAYRAVAADGLEVALYDDVEGDVSAWTISDDRSLTAGTWEQANPNGTIFNAQLAAPEDDATPEPGNVQAFVTENGPPGGQAGANDVDGGPTRLVTPVFDLNGADAIVSYARWLFSETGNGDLLTVEVTNDGANWIEVEQVASTQSQWQAGSLIVGEFVTPNSSVQVRFSVADEPNDSITEAGIDDLLVEKLLCHPACPWDLDGSGSVGTADLLALLSAWGTDPAGPPDFGGDGNVGTADLLELLSHWGPCPAG